MRAVREDACASDFRQSPTLHKECRHRGQRSSPRLRGERCQQAGEGQRKRSILITASTPASLTRTACRLRISSAAAARNRPGRFRKLVLAGIRKSSGMCRVLPATLDSGTSWITVLPPRPAAPPSRRPCRRLDGEGAGIEGFLGIDRADHRDGAARHVAQRVDAGPLARQALGTAPARRRAPRSVPDSLTLPCASRSSRSAGTRLSTSERPSSVETPSDTATMQRLWRSSVLRHIVDEARHREAALRHVDQMRAAVPVKPPGRSGCGQEAGVAAHDDADIDAGQRAEIEIDAEEGAGDELAGRNEARRVVVLDQIVVDGLRRMHEGHRAAGRLGQDLLRARRYRCRRYR